MTDGRHIHLRPRGDLVLCDGCRTELVVAKRPDDVAADVADALVANAGWLVTHSQLRSFHWCGACRGKVEGK